MGSSNVSGRPTLPGTESTLRVDPSLNSAGSLLHFIESPDSIFAPIECIRSNGGACDHDIFAAL